MFEEESHRSRGGKQLNPKALQKDALRVLKETSRTFYTPIILLEPTLKKTVASAYLCMRAIDEVEDHEQLDTDTKERILYKTSELLQEKTFDEKAYRELVTPHESLLPEVTLRLGDWLSVCPTDIVERVKQSTSEMAKGMGEWARKGWRVETKEDLDEYTYYVAGLVGVMLSDIWEWRDGTKTDRKKAIAYGRGLQIVNILRNQEEDRERGVTFIPKEWSVEKLFHYADENLAIADEYIKDIRSRSILLFCRIPLALAKKTLQALRDGREKMTREEVEQTVLEIQQSN